MCSLQEAYQIPSFAATINKKCPPAQARASADPFDPFYPENGHGEKAKYGMKKEGFRNRAKHSENFVGGGSGDNVSYKSQSTDNDYYCKTYGICSIPQNKPVPKPNPDVPTTGRIEGFTNPGAGSCTNNAPLRYEYPMSPEAKAAYERALKTSFDSDVVATSTLLVEPQARKADMEGVMGYEDEDLEKYLQTKDMKAAPMLTVPVSNMNAQPYDPKESPFAKAMQHFQKEENKVPAVLKENLAADAPTSTPQQAPQSHFEKVANTIMSKRGDFMVWDLIVVILIGILVIFLCDQLFRIGVMVGMRKTVQLLEPFLEKP